MALDTTAGVEVELLIPSMTCAGCMRKVETALGSAPGVLSARANLTQHRARVSFDPQETDAEALISALGATGYAARPYDPGTDGNQADAEARDLLMRIGVSGFAAMNVMLLSIGVWSGADGAMRDLLHWASAFIALPAMAYAGIPFFRNAAAALAARRLAMDVPISLAILLSAASSVFETADSGEHAYFDAGIMLIFFLLIGRYLETRMRARARSAASELMAMTGRHATQVTPDGPCQITVDQIAPGMLLQIAAGDRIPADGIIESGQTALDRALITGESLPVEAGPDAEVHAGVLNVTGPITVRVTKAGSESLLAEIADLVAQAEQGRGRFDGLADRAARIYAPGVHLLSALAFVGWVVATGDAHLAVQIAVAVLIITCPCALALAVPTVHTVASARLFRAGIFLKDGAALEKLSSIDTVVFDKTGTLTDGQTRLDHGPAFDDPAWPVAAALAQRSRHPFSQAIAAAATEAGVAPAPVTDLTEVPGQGVEGLLNGAVVRLGKPVWAGGSQSDQVTVLLPDGTTAGFRFQQSLRPDAVNVCAALRANGLRVEILSGDHSTAVAEVAHATGVDHALAGLTPQEKHTHVKALGTQGRNVLMVGDGLNDNPALAAAQVSMSPASAMDATQSVADLVFLGSRLSPVLVALDLAGTARRRAYQSIAVAAVYNAFAIPLAIAGFVTPLIAALAMSGSSVAVILNALRMKVKT